MRVIVAILIACVGCQSVHHSTLPPYVRELRMAPGGLEVIRCEIVHTKTERTSGWGVGPGAGASVGLASEGPLAGLAALAAGLAAAGFALLSPLEHGTGCAPRLDSCEPTACHSCWASGWRMSENRTFPGMIGTAVSGLSGLL